MHKSTYFCMSVHFMRVMKKLFYTGFYTRILRGTACWSGTAGSVVSTKRYLTVGLWQGSKSEMQVWQEMLGP